MLAEFCPLISGKHAVFRRALHGKAAYPKQHSRLKAQGFGDGVYHLKIVYIISHHSYAVFYGFFHKAVGFGIAVKVYVFMGYACL